MATRNTANTKRVLSRPADKKPEAFFIPATRSGSNIPQPLPPPSTVVRATDVIAPRSEVATPARRIVVIRNTKHAPDDQGPIDLSDLDQSNSFEDSSMVTDGQKSILFVRRPVVPPEASKPVKSYPAVHEPSHATTLKHTRTSTSPQENPRRLKIKSRTPSPSHRNAIRRSPSPNRRPPTYYTPSPPPSPPKQEESQEIDSNRGFYSLELIRSPTESINSQSPEIIENEHQTTTYHLRTTRENTPEKDPTKSLHPNDQPVVVIENSPVKDKSFKPGGKHSEKTRSEDKTSRWQTCLGCLSRYMWLNVLICTLVVLIGLAGVIVSAYFYATNSTSFPAPKIVGIAIGGVLVIVAFALLYTLLGFTGARDGYFKYKEAGSHFSGRAFALLPLSHPNADHYIPRVATPPSTQQETNVDETKSKKNKIIIEMPAQFVSGRQISPQTRQRSFNKVAKNIRQVVEDTKKRYNGEAPSKVIIKMDENTT